MRILELGGGYNPTENAEVLDINPNAKNVVWVGDIRGLWSRDYEQAKGNLGDISENAYDLINATHFVEHIEWIHQEALFQQVHRWLVPNGEFRLETPNLVYIVKHYLIRRYRCSFPLGEHPDIVDRTGVNHQKWVNFKLFSGCSKGDYHHVCYDNKYLGWMFQQTGFVHVKIRASETLKAVAKKPKDTGEAILRFEYEG